MKIIKMTPSHLNEVMKIAELSFSNPWSFDSFNNELNNSSSLCFVSVDESDFVTGYVIMSRILDEGYLLDIAVHPDYRRKKIASALMTQILNLSKECNLAFLSLEVRASNLAASKLYSSFGFEAVSVRKDYYTSPKEDAVIMTKYFKKEE